MEPTRQRPYLVAIVGLLAVLMVMMGGVLIRTMGDADGDGSRRAVEGRVDADGNGVPDALDESISELASGDAETAASATRYAAALEQALSLPPDAQETAEAIAREMDAALHCSDGNGLGDDAVVVEARVLALSLNTPEREQAWVQFDEMIGGISGEACK